MKFILFEDDPETELKSIKPISEFSIVTFLIVELLAESKLIEPTYILKFKYRINF